MSLALLLALWAGAWDRHDLLTRSALAGTPEEKALVAVETLESYLSRSSRTVAGFLREHKLNPGTRFDFRLGEKPGADASAAEVVAGYADEPDWDMDQDLFAHYPELWKPEYRYMGGKTGSQTRAFRHMHWPKGFWKGPPPVYDKTPLGEAPERAALFFKLAEEARAAGRGYWAARFLAWSLHYLQDLTQPFHAAQLPSHKLVRTKPDGTIDLEATTRSVIFFHLTLDAGAWRLDRARAVAACAGGAEPAMGDVAKAAAALASAAEAEASDAGETLVDYLPRPADADLADPVGRVFSDEYWTDVNALPKPVEREAALQLVEDLLRPAGRATRAALSRLSTNPVTIP